MKKVIVYGMLTAANLSSCTMPWSKESPSALPPPIAPAVIDGRIDSPVVWATWAVATPDANPPAAGSGIVDANPPTGTAVPPTKPTAPQSTWSGSVPQASTGTVDDAEVKAAVDEIDKLFDGIAGDTGPEKK